MNFGGSNPIQAGSQVDFPSSYVDCTMLLTRDKVPNTCFKSSNHFWCRRDTTFGGSDDDYSSNFFSLVFKLYVDFCNAYNFSSLFLMCYLHIYACIMSQG